MKATTHTSPAQSALPLRIAGARKAFGGVVAVHGVDLEVSPGEAVAVIGPNGAGKSTLLKLVAGVHRPDAGEIRLGDRRLDRLAAHQITRSGVALAHQVPRPFTGMTVLQNVQVGAMAARPGLSAGELTELLDLCGLAGKAGRSAGSLGVLDLKRLEVARALATRPQVLMLDEVAAGLVARELDQAIEMIRRIHRTGVSLLLVEHIERVVREIVGRVLVLDWGKPIAAGTPEEVARNAQVRAVYLGDGQDTAESLAARPQPVPGRPHALVIENLTAGYGSMVALRDVSFTIGEGEIIVVLGANGAGKSTLCGAIMGTVAPSSGSVTAFGTVVTGLPVHERARRGIACCQEGRRVFADLTVAENLALGAPLSLPAAELRERLARVHDTFPVLAERKDQRAGTLSGGQQQMLAVGRALMARPRLLICDEISLGLAPLAVDALYSALGTINSQGVAILLVEQNVHRSLKLADHAIVLSRGRVTYAGDPRPLLTDADLDAAYFGHHENPADLSIRRSKHMFRRSLRITAGLAGLLLAAGCAGNATTATSSGSGSTGPIVIGASMALSGQVNLASTLAGYQMKINQVNNAGGLVVGGVKRKIEFKVLDNRGDTSTMLQQVRQLVLSDGAVALLGSCCQENIDMEAQADALKVPLVEVDLPVELMPKGNGYTWDAFQALADAAREFYQLAGTVSSNKKTLIVTDNDAEGLATARQWTQLGAQAGFTAAATKAVPIGTTDFSNVIAAGKSTGAQILIAAMTPPDCFAMWKQMKALSYTPKLAIGLQCAQTPGWQSLGSLGNGTLVVMEWSKTAGLPYTKQIVRQYGGRFPSPTDLASVPGGYQAADILLTAIQHAGSAKPQAINKAIAAVHIDSALGPVSFTGNASVSPTYIGQWENGGVTQVWPAKGAGTLQPLSGLS